MFIKRMISLLIASLMLVILGCDLKTNEAPPPPRVAKFVTSDKIACLSRTVPYFSAFLSGEPQGKKIGEFWDCASTALEVFSEKSEGDLKTGYSTQALIKFLETYFLEPGVVLNDDLVTEVMRIKQLFVGGELDSFKKEELKQFILILKKLNKVTTRLAPFMKIYFHKWNPTTALLVDDEIRYFEDGISELQIFARQLSELIRKDSPPYKIDYFFKFLDSMRPILGTNLFSKGQQEEIAQLLKKVKVALAGGDEEVIQSNEWRRFLLIGLRGYAQTLRFQYFVANADSGRTHQIIFLARAVDDVFSMVADLVSEKPEQTLTRKELSDILSKLGGAYPEFKSSDALLLELMKIKRVFFGGSINSWTVEEFLRARQKIKVFRDITLRLVPYLPVYDGTWDVSLESSEEGHRYFKEAHRVLGQSALELGGIIEDSYNLEDLNRLAEELGQLYPESFLELAKMSKGLVGPLVAYKNLVVSDEDAVIQPSEWSEFLSFSAQLFEKFQFYNYFVKSNDIRIGEGRDNFKSLSLNTLAMLENLSQKKKAKEISTQEIFNLVDSLKETRGFDSEKKRKSIKSTFKLFLERVLTPAENRLAGQPSKGIGALEINELRKEVKKWFGAQIAIGEVLNEVIDARVAVKRVTDLIQNIEKNWTGDAIERNGIRNLSYALSTSFPLIVNEKGFLQIQKYPAVEPQYDLKSLTQTNTMSLLISLFQKSYSSSLDAIEGNKGFTSEEFQVLVKEVVPVLVEAGILSDYKDTYASSRLLEANLFSFRGNGDARFDFQEGHDYLPMLYNGVLSDRAVQAHLKKNCMTQGLESILTAMVDQKCYRNEFLKIFPVEFTHVPGFVQTWPNSQEGQLKALEGLEKAAGFSKAVGGYISLKEVSLLSNIIQYIEVILVRFDKNNDGFLNTKESLNAFPIFREKLVEISGSTNDSTLEAIFTYILKYGEPPKKSVGGIFKFLKWKSARDSWDVWADRQQLTKILVSLQQKAKPKTNP